MTTIASFDVFDTVLTRAAGSPLGVFMLLGGRLQRLGLIACSVEQFARARSQAEWRAFKRAGGLDSQVGLVQIYQELANTLGLTASHAAALPQHELELEGELMRLVPEAASKVAIARAAGQRIVYISDMYLDCETIGGLLQTHGLLAQGDGCYISWDHGASKESGALYRLVLQREGVRATQLRHHGNNPSADVRAARRLGIAASSLDAANLNRYEATLEAATADSAGLASLLAGASRLARLSTPAASAHEQALRDVSASIAAPLLVALTLWMLGRAHNHGLKRLYFMARDGQIVLELARILAPRLGISCELRYLYASRQAWLLPTIFEVTDEQLGRVLYREDFFSGSEISVEGALARLEITPAEVRKELEGLGFAEARWAENLSQAERERLYQGLLEQPQLRTLVGQRAAAARARTLAYLRQEGMFDGEPYAIFDLGTHGTLHRALVWLAQAADAPPPLSFYLGCDQSEVGQHGDRMEAYLYDARMRRTLPAPPGLVTFLEIVCSADHGTVLTYEQRPDGQLAPVLKPFEPTTLNGWGYSLVRVTILRFAEELGPSLGLTDPFANVREAVLGCFSQLWLSPNRQEAQNWGDFPFDDGWGERSAPLHLITPYDWNDLLQMARGRWPDRHRHFWRAGSAALSPLPLRAFVGAVIVAQRVAASPRPLRTLVAGLRRLPAQLLRWFALLGNRHR